MAEAERKDSRVSKGQTSCSEGERVTVTYNRCSLQQGADIFKKQPSVNDDVSFVDQMRITLANFPLVQVGRILTEVEPCRKQGCKRLQGLVELVPDTAETPLKIKSTPDDTNSSVPDDVCKLHSNSSQVSSIPAVQTRYNDDDAQAAGDKQVAAAKARKRNDRLSDIQKPMPRIKKQGSLAGKKCEIVMRTLEELQDDGRFKAHDYFVCKLLQFFTKNNDLDMVASVKIERGVARYYENDLRGSRKLCKDVIRMGESLQNRNLLQGRAYVLLATTYRRQTKSGTAFKYLQNAEQLLSHYKPGEDTAELFYNYAVEWLHFHWSNFADDKSRQVSKARAKEYYELAIAHSAKDKRPRVQFKKKILFNIRLAGLHLDCGTRAARETRQVTGEDIRKAKKHLDFVEHYLSDYVSPSMEIKLLITRSDQYYREGKFFVAKETAQEALALAKRINMNMHIGPLNERIEERGNLLLTASPISEMGLNMSRFISADSGWSAGVSSCSA